MGVTIVYGGITGLEPGAHGFHAHRDPDLGNGCLAAGPHYNPFNMTHGFHNMARHLGDLGNIFTWPKEPVTPIHIVDSLISWTQTMV
ncbi:Superoxide dismutase, partial [Caligus rogercresseyi]